MTKPLEQMTDNKIMQAKRQIARACKIDCCHISYFNEEKQSNIVDERMLPHTDFIVNHKGKNKLEISLDNLVRIQHSVRFENCEFVENISGAYDFYRLFVFYRCIFKKKFRIINANEISLVALDCDFLDEFLVMATTIKQICIKSIFMAKIDFYTCEFLDIAIFEGSEFLESVSLSDATFNKSVSFSDTIFKYPPNLSQTIFKDEVNFVGTEMDFNYKILDKTIDGCAKKEECKKFFLTHKHRDSFRLIKNSLAKNGNTLDASQYHKMELYCKEIELESKEQKSPSDWLEKWQLWFYRKTSDHHTDLLMIVSWVMACIGLFGLVSFGYRHGGQLIDSSEIDRYPVMHFLEGLWGAEVYRASSESGFVLLAIGVSAVGLLSNFSRMILGVLLSLCVVISNPKNIFGVAKLFEGQKISGAENVIIFFYAFVMILLLFSLQKTARKNTITPS